MRIHVVLGVEICALVPIEMLINLFDFPQCIIGWGLSL